MAAILNKCPMVDASDCLISFLQYLFSNPEMTPDEYRWNVNDRATRIFISGPYTVGRDKVGAMPTVTVTSGNFNYNNLGVNNLSSADKNTFENQEFLDLMDGPVAVIVEAGTESEATSMANFIALMIHANRMEIKAQFKFLHRIIRTAISQAVPTKESAEIERWQSTASFMISLYSGWVKSEKGLARWNKVAIHNGSSAWESALGETVQGSDLFFDNSANFGMLTTNSPQLLQQELERKWYFINLGDDAKKYTIEEIVNSTTLRLSMIDEGGNSIPYAANVSQLGITYSLLWNTVHISIEIKK